MNIKKPHRLNATISLTPLIDVVFILLIFFMTTMSFKNLKTLNFDIPKTTGNQTFTIQKNTVILNITKNSITIKKQKFSDINAVMQFIRTHNKKVNWGLKPNKTISIQRYLHVWKTLADNGITTHIIANQPKTKVKK